MLDGDGLAEGEELESNILRVGPAQSSEFARNAASPRLRPACGGGTWLSLPPGLWAGGDEIAARDSAIAPLGAAPVDFDAEVRILPPQPASPVSTA